MMHRQSVQSLYGKLYIANITTTFFLNDSLSCSVKFVTSIWCIIVKGRVIYSKLKHFPPITLAGIYTLLFSLFSFITELAIAVSIFSPLSYDIESKRSLNVSISSLLLVILWGLNSSPAVKGVSFWFRDLAWFVF